MLNLIVEKVWDETERIRVFTLKNCTDRPLPSFTPGAHITVELGILGTRSYSLIDWSNETYKPKNYIVAVQREDNGLGGSIEMYKLDIGRKLKASDPTNNFKLKTEKAPVVLLAGGIGITPLISMATYLKSSNIEFNLHYSARSEKNIAFQKALTEKFTPNVSFYFDDKKPLNLDKLAENMSRESQLYICGPQGFICEAQKTASKLGISKEKVFIELFNNTHNKTANTSFEVEIKSTGEVYTIPADKTIIQILEDKGLDLIYDCQRGDCGICQTDVLEGLPDHRDVVLSKDEKESGKVMQICVSRAKSSRLILDL